jgi:hypothetical protein
MLLEDPAISGIIGDKIFPLLAKEGTSGMYVVYQRDRYSVDRTKMGQVLNSCWVYIYVIGPDYDDTQDLAEKIFTVLDGDHPNGLRIWLADSTEDVIGEGQNKKIIQVLLFEIS